MNSIIIALALQRFAGAENKPHHHLYLGVNHKVKITFHVPHVEDLVDEPADVAMERFMSQVSAWLAGYPNKVEVEVVGGIGPL